MKKTKVSVIIPVYNSEKYLEACLDSIINQTLEDIEIICVDDGSQDQSLVILHWYEMKYDNIHIISQQNQYAGAARNNGMAIASGEYIIFLDSDDMIKPEMLQKMYDKSRLMDSDICICGADLYDNSTGITYGRKRFLHNLPEKDPFSWRDMPDSIYDITTPAVWNMLFKADFIKNNGLSFEKCKRANDLRFFGCSLPMAERITVVQDKFVLYRTGHTTNLQSKHEGELFTEYNSLKQIRAFLIERNIFNQIETAFIKLSIRNMNYALSRKNSAEYRELLLHIQNDEDPLFRIDQLKYIFSDDDISYVKIKNHFRSLSKDYEEEGTITLCNLKERKPVDISVIVTAYNDGAYLTECLNSIINQTFRDFELIIVNDGSSDNTGQICKEFLKNSSIQMVYISKENGGLSTARNCGLDYAMGKYVKFLDGDDYYTSDALELCHSAMEKHGVSVLLTNIKAYPDIINDEVLEEKVQKFNNYYSRKHNYAIPCCGKDMFIKMVIQKEFLVSMGSMTFLRSFIEENQIRFIENLFHEDDLFAIDAMMQSNAVMYLDKTIYMRRVREGSIMTDEEINISKGESKLIIAEKIFSDYYYKAMKYEDSRLVFCLEKFINEEIVSAIELIFSKPSKARYSKYILPYAEKNPILYGKICNSYYSAMNSIKLKKRISILEKNNLKLENRIYKMGSSKVWRYTKPIRRIKRLLIKNL